jgi:transposase
MPPPASTSTIQPRQVFAASLRRSAAEIVNYAKQRIANGNMEGFNNRISRLIHRANGVRSIP